MHTQDKVDKIKEKKSYSERKSLVLEKEQQMMDLLLRYNLLDISSTITK